MVEKEEKAVRKKRLTDAARLAQGEDGRRGELQRERESFSRKRRETKEFDSQDEVEQSGKEW